MQYQTISAGKAKARFSIALTKGKATPFTGSLVRWLQSRNIVIRTPRALSRAQRQILNRTDRLAGYMELDPVSNQLLAGWIDSKGKVGMSRLYSEWRRPGKAGFLPITSAEAKMLKQGDKAWPWEGIPHQFEYESRN